MEQNQAQTSIDDLFVQAVTPPPAPVEPSPQLAPDPALAQPQVPVQPPAPPAPHMVPLAVLMDERGRYQDRIEKTEQRLADIQRALEVQYRASQPPPQPIDPVAEPERFAAAVQHELARKDQQMQEMAIHQRANTSEMLARQKHGDQVVDQALKDAISTGLNRNFMMQPDPYRALLDWHTSQSVAKQVGPDLTAYREKVRQEIIAEMRGGKPAPQNLPPSLATATNAGNANPLVPEPSAIFENMFARKR